MNNLKLITQFSPWFIFLCLSIGAGYAALLYAKKSTWGKNSNYFLAGIRFLLVSILCFLLLGPYIKHFKNDLENPSIVIAVDNSQSMVFGDDSLKLKELSAQLFSLANSLEEKKANVEIRLLDKNIAKDKLSSLKYQNTTSNISRTLTEIQSDYANRNLSGIVLVSDGIYNQGIAPNYLTYKTPVYTVGMGDTIPKKDINVKSLLYNKITYTGNKFPIVAEIHSKGYTGKKIPVYLKQKNKVIASQEVAFSSDKGITEVRFETSASSTGLQHYVVEAALQQDEFTKINNVNHAYVEVLEGKEKILLIGTSPHPDIKALKNAIEKKQNYELQIYIPGINEYKNDKYDLVIFHQLPDFYNSARDVKDKFLKDETSLLFIAGSQTNLNAFNIENKVLKISGNFNQTDNVTAVFNPEFNKFKFEQADKNTLSNYPPITVPFGNYVPTGEMEVVLYQKVGNISTQKPILCISNKAKKVGAFIGEGLWEWQLHEFQETQDSKTFDKLIISTVQFLSSKEDKRKFRFYPVTNQFSITDPVLFEVETYNDVYEKIYGQKIDLKITDESGNNTSYTFENGENTPRFEVKGLKQGVYKYSASVTLFGKQEKSQGEFSINELNLESVNTTADHELLRQLSKQSGGKYVNPEATASLSDLISATKLQSVIHTNEVLDEIINLPLVGLFLLLLASTEWFIRKYKGGY